MFLGDETFFDTLTCYHFWGLYCIMRCPLRTVVIFFEKKLEAQNILWYRLHKRCISAVYQSDFWTLEPWINDKASLVRDYTAAGVFFLFRLHILYMERKIIQWLVVFFLFRRAERSLFAQRHVKMISFFPLRDIPLLFNSSNLIFLGIYWSDSSDCCINTTTGSWSIIFQVFSSRRFFSASYKQWKYYFSELFEGKVYKFVSCLYSKCNVKSVSKNRPKTSWSLDWFFSGV